MKSFTVVIGPPVSAAEKEKFAQFGRNAGRHADEIWVEYIHEVMRSFSLRDGPDAKSNFDTLFSEILKVEVCVGAPFLTCTYAGHNKNPGMIWRPDQFTDVLGGPVTIDWLNDDALRTMCNVLGDVLGAAWVRYYWFLDE